MCRDREVETPGSYSIWKEILCLMQKQNWRRIPYMLFECELYDELRNTLVPRYFRTRPSMFKLIEFINSASNKQIRGLAKLVYNAFKIRSNLVWPTGNHFICAYTCTFELFMLLLTFCSCFIWFQALVTDLLPCWPCVFYFVSVYFTLVRACGL